MKTIIRITALTAMLLLPITALVAQNDQTNKDFKQPPKSTEIILGVITDTRSGGYKYDEFKAEYVEKIGYNDYTESFFTYTAATGKYLFVSTNDYTTNYSEEQLLESLMSSAKNKYGKDYPNFSLRDFKWKRDYTYNAGKERRQNEYKYTYTFSATVVITDPKVVANENLSKAIDKALLEVREGSRIAIDQIRVPTGMDKEDYKDEVVEILLDKGFKVVAKEYLEKLYEEQQAQQSGIYNDRTTVKDNNFSAVGYYLNVRLTETALRVQVINVSTGEYEGNVTIKLQQ